jgi:hypothetical protein
MKAMNLGGDNNREAAARSADIALESQVLGRLSMSELIRTAGDAETHADYVLGGYAETHKHHLPRTAMYMVTDFNHGVTITGRRLLPTDEETAKWDQLTMAQAVQKEASQAQPFSYGAFVLIHLGSVMLQNHEHTGEILSAGAELRMAPDHSTYTALLLPRFLRWAPEVAAHQLRKLRGPNSNNALTSELAEIADKDNRRSVLRRLALAAMSHHTGS